LRHWSLAVNDFLGVPRTGWGENLPSVPIVLAALAMAWVFWVTLMILTGERDESRPEVHE
jgi:hypothetical protein